MKTNFHNDFLNKSVSIITIAAIGVVAIATAENDKGLVVFLRNNKTFAYVVGSIFIIAPIVIPFVYPYIRKIRLRSRKLSSTIIERQEIVIDIFKKGKKANYKEIVTFHKVAKDDKALMEMRVSGTIKPISGLNCDYNLNTVKNSVILDYKDYTASLNKYSPLLNKHKKFLMFTAILNNAFIAKVEYWDLLPKHYCKDYELQIILPKKAKFKLADIFKVVLDSNGKEKEELINEIRPIISFENERTKIIMKIIDFDYGELIRLRWEVE